MASMNDLLDRFRVQTPNPEPPPEPVRETKKPKIQIGAVENAVPPAGPQVTLKKNADSQTGQAKTGTITILKPGGQTSQAGGTQRGGGSQSGVFGGGRSSGSQSGVFGSGLSGGGTGGRHRDRGRTDWRQSAFWSTLPPLWGVDLVLIVISVAAALGILFNLSAVLLSLARLVLSVAEFFMGITMIVGVGIIVMFVLRRGRRRRW